MTSITEGSFTKRQRDGSSNNKQEIEELYADVILGIYYRSSHWTLVVVEMKSGKVYFYNPCGETGMEMKKIERNWRKYVEDLQNSLGTYLPPKEWRVTNVAHARQKDSFNCGVYCLIFAEKHLTDKLADLKTISESDLEDMRIAVAKHLMLYEVYLTECCPKCSFDIGDEESIKCKECQRSFHFRSFCIEDDLKNLEDSESFRCRLCKINWVERQKAVQEGPAENQPREEKGYFFRKNAGKKRKRNSFVYPDIRG
ncbi:uncharacterized protein LOC134272747, partial [Saccostrea cucullata]|uniref:uncharacterized protein LOC134272747 n=1 Tax=Saccostrea cuccullata TaxID=36930 RepID=UPI002ED123FD